MISELLKIIPFLRHMRARLAEHPVSYRLARGAFWSLAGAIGLRALTFVASVVVARVVGREGYGELGIIQSTLGMFAILAGFGMGTAATKYVAEFRRSDPAKAHRVANFSLVFALLCSGIMSATCEIFAPWLAAHTLSRPEIASVLRSASLLLFLSTVGGVQSAILAGFEAFKTIAKINLLQGIAALAIVYPLVHTYSVAGAVASLTISAAVSVALSAIAIHAEYRANGFSHSHIGSLLEEWPIVWKFALPATISGLLVAPVTWVTNAILVNQPGGYGEMGLFNAANQWRMAIVSLLTVLMTSMIPVLSETYGRVDRSDFRKIVSLNFRLAILIALPVTVSIMALGVPTAALFGKQYMNAAPLIAILMAATFMHVVTGTVSSALAGAGRIWTGVMMNFVWAIAMVACSYGLVPRFGGKGLAIAYAVSYAVHGILVLIYAEFKVAPSAVLSRWQWILFSLFVLVACTLVCIEESMNLYHFAFIIFALVPAMVHVWPMISNRARLNSALLK